jgi:hypothetical protein
MNIKENMMEKKPSEYISEFLNFIAEAQVQHRIYEEEVNTQDKLTQDFLHKLELGELKCEERSKVATKLAINRQDRRYYKDRVEELKPIVTFFEDPASKKMLVSSDVCLAKAESGNLTTKIEHIDREC